MKKYIVAAISGSLAGIVLTASVAGPLIADESDRRKSTYEQLDLFGDIFERIRSQYVEEVDEADLIESAINGMLTSLDPHSSYLPPKDFDAMQVQTRGEFGGLGIEVTMEDGYVKVVSPIDDTPADKAGMQAGDFVTHVDGESVLGLTLNEAVDRMRGPVGSEIVITVVRDGVDDPFDVSIIRDTIKIAAVKTRMEGDAIVMRISSFTDQTYKNLKDTLDDAVTKAEGIDNISGVILDLRNNPGGLLDQAILVSNAFLNEGEIVSTRGRSTADSERYNATPGDLAEGKPIVILINGGSASASEIVAGALQDHRRAIVVGTKSFGKGSVQTIMPLQGDGAMRLTTSRYYTPSGRSIQALGVSPDILVEQRNTPMIDIAYQGFGDGLEDDAAATRLLASRFPEMLISSSCSKNFGIYRERTGIVIATNADSDSREITQGNMAHLNRQNFSFPPDHGARMVTMILQDPDLRADWKKEVEDIRLGLLETRQALADELQKLSGSNRFGFIAQHRGMFSRIGATPEQVLEMREKHGVYIVGDSRINIAGLNKDTIPVLAAAMIAVGV